MQDVLRDARRRQRLPPPGLNPDKKERRAHNEAFRSETDYAESMEPVPQGRADVLRGPSPGMAHGKGRNGQRGADRGSKAAAGITEDTNTWSGWKKAGYEVIHGSKALFGCDLIYGSKGDGAIYKARFFGASQVQALA